MSENNITITSNMNNFNKSIDSNQSVEAQNNPWDNFELDITWLQRKTDFDINVASSHFLKSSISKEATERQLPASCNPALTESDPTKVHFNLPKAVNDVLNRLNQAGEGFVVGGAVRDFCLGRQPKDYDFTTNLSYEDTAALFPEAKTQPIGKAFGVLEIKLGDQRYEIAQYREDQTDDGRQNTIIRPAPDLATDLHRRDFTINALAYHPQTGLIDLHDGREDLKNRRIDFIGNSSQRITEDGLRILRAFRLASQLDFTISIGALLSIRAHSDKLNEVSRERIGEELSKTLMGENPSAAIAAMGKTGVLEQILPSFQTIRAHDQAQRNPESCLFPQIVENLKQTPDDLPLRYAVLFKDLAKPLCRNLNPELDQEYAGHEKVGAALAEQACFQLKLPKQLTEQIIHLVANQSILVDCPDDRSMAKLIRQIGAEQVDRLLVINTITGLSDDPEVAAEQYQMLANQYQRALWLARTELNTHTLNIRGHEIAQYGFKKAEIGAMKEQILAAILNDEISNHTNVIKKYLEKEAERQMKPPIGKPKLSEKDRLDIHKITTEFNGSATQVAALLDYFEDFPQKRHRIHDRIPKAEAMKRISQVLNALDCGALDRMPRVDFEDIFGDMMTYVEYLDQQHKDQQTESIDELKDYDFET